MSRKHRTPIATLPPPPGDDLARRYDEVPYPANPFPFTHPDRLGVVAMLHGLKPRAADRCRVLEIGCGDGVNLVAMAIGLPQSEFVGVDIAAQPIARGHQLLAELGLANVRLVQADLRAIGEDYGQFDYIISHGLYSWVPPEVRDGLMAVCRARLADRGLVYISYNAMPGGHIRRMLREMMLFHTRGFEEPMEKAQEARAFLRFLAAGAKAAKGGLYADIMAQEADRTKVKRDADIFHDDLAAINDPVYFTAFIHHAAQHGLRFLGEAEHYETDATVYGPEIGEQLTELATQDVLLKEQYMDFLDCRFFRKTLLCKAEFDVRFDFDTNAITPLHVTSDAAPQPVPDPEQGQTFHSERFGGVTVKDPLFISAMTRLQAAYPASIPFSRLLDMAIEDAGEAAPSRYKATQRLAEFVERSFGAGVLELYARPAPHQPAGERPVASPLARLQAKDSRMVITLLQELFVLNEGDEQTLVPLLDGTRTRAELAAALPPGEHGDAAARVDAALARFEKNALLMA